MNRKPTNRRQFLQSTLLTTAGLTGAGLTTGGILFSPAAMAKGYPSRNIDTLIPFSPGGGTDRSVRIIASAWEKALQTGYRFRLNNQPGAGTLVAHNTLKNSRPDAHTVLITPMPHVAWLSVLEEKPRFDLDQISWIGSYFQDPNVLLVAKDSPYQSAQEMIDDAKKNNKTLTASVSSPMSAAHAATVIFRERAGINIRVVPFAGGAESRNAVAGGHVDMCMAPYWSAINVLELTRALCIFAPKDPSQGLWDAPAANDVLDFKMPTLIEPYSALISSASKDNNSDAYKALVSSFEQAVNSQQYQTEAKKQDLGFFSSYWNPQECDQFLDDYLQLLHEYIPSMREDIQSM